MLLKDLELLLLGQLECSPAQLRPGCNSLWRSWGVFFEQGQSEVLGSQAVQDQLPWGSWYLRSCRANHLTAWMPCLVDAVEQLQQSLHIQVGPVQRHAQPEWMAACLERRPTA